MYEVTKNKYINDLNIFLALVFALIMYLVV